MKFGYFDDLCREYIITTPKTPLPWINYLGSKDFFSLISNTLGGYSFYKDAKFRRITRYRYNDVPNDFSGRFYYVKDHNEIWNPSYLPCGNKLDKYECHHGLGYTNVIGKKNGLECQVLCFVPIDENCEINKITLNNDSEENKTIDFYGCVEFCLWNALDDNTNFQRNLNIAEVEVDHHTIYHKTEYRERRNHFAYFYCNEKHIGFDTDRDLFLGQFNGFNHPDVVFKNKSLNTEVYGGEPIGCHHLKIKLKPHEEKTIIFILGYIENDENQKFIGPNIINKNKAYEVMNKYKNAFMVDAEFDRLNTYWNSLLSKFQIKTNNDKLDRMVNIWNQYQCMITYCMSRSASYYESGIGRGMGFRDSCQDILGFVHLVPSIARTRIIDIASIQFEDGSTYHQYQPLSKRGNADIGSGFNDDPLWLIAATSAYIKETGDISILSENVPFNNVIGSEKTLYEHLLISLNYTINNLGPHGLPLIGRADWNDCLNLNCFSSTPGESFQTVENFESRKAESIFIAGMFVKYGKEFVDIASLIGKDMDAKYIKKYVNLIENNTIKYGWDGEWFLRAYDAYGNKVGSQECDEGRIFIEPQGFCTFAGIGKDLNYGKKALMSVKKYLQNDYGDEIVYPPFTYYHIELGEISSYPPGHKENGSVFCHNNPWVTLGFCKERMPEEAFDNYIRNAPSFIEDKSDIHQTEPYVYSQTIAGRCSENYGRAKNSWLTGTASWSFVAISQGILGIKPTLSGLLIDPCLPKCLNKIKIVRYYRDKEYIIEIDNKCRDQTEVFVENQLIEDKIIPLNIQAKTINVTVKM